MIRGDEPNLIKVRAEIDSGHPEHSVMRSYLLATMGCERRNGAWNMQDSIHQLYVEDDRLVIEVNSPVAPFPSLVTV